jgi:hypothetical protein
MSGIFSTEQDAAAACTLPYHMESVFIFVSFRGISQAISDDCRGAKSSRKNADGKKHIFILEHNLYQIPRRPWTLAISGVRPLFSVNSAIFSLSNPSQSVCSCSLIEHAGLHKKPIMIPFKSGPGPDRKAGPQIRGSPDPSGQAVCPLVHGLG